MAIIDTLTGKARCPMVDRGSGDDFIKAVSMSPRGSYLAVVNSGRLLTITSAVTCQPVSRVRLTNDVVTAMTFSPDESYVALFTKSEALARDGLVNVWEVTSGREVARQLSAASAAAELLIFSADGRVLGRIDRETTGSVDTVRLWHWRLDEAIKEACARLSRNLTVDEWRRYLGDEPYPQTCSNLPAPELPAVSP
jgi:WD40 repeat protein